MKNIKIFCSERKGYIISVLKLEKYKICGFYKICDWIQKVCDCIFKAVGQFTTNTYKLSQFPYLLSLED